MQGNALSRLMKIAGLRRDLALARLAETATERGRLTDARAALAAMRSEAATASLTTPGYLPFAAHADRLADRRDAELAEAIRRADARYGSQLHAAAQDFGRAETLGKIDERMKADCRRTETRKLGENG